MIVCVIRGHHNVPSSKRLCMFLAMLPISETHADEDSGEETLALDGERSAEDTLFAESLTTTRREDTLEDAIFFNSFPDDADESDMYLA